MAATARILAWLWLASLLALVLAFRLVGERWWPLAVLLYLPRLGFGLPLLVILPLGLRGGMRGAWLPIAASLLVLLFPLMGLRLSRAGAASGPTLRVMSYNVWYGHFGAAAILEEIEAAGPDVVALQAYDPRLSGALRAHFPGWHFHEDDDFLVASRFPIHDVWKPPPLAAADREKPAFRRYTLDTLIGRVDLFCTHPYSARDGISALRDGDGRLAPRVADNAAVRRAQVIALSDEAARSRNPVIIAGDTNLPGLSEILRRYLGRYHDGFDSAGTGFGYTFPAHHVPWMRIDRILVGEGLRVTRFYVGGRRGSDHCPVVAEIVAARP